MMPLDFYVGLYKSLPDRRDFLMESFLKSGVDLPSNFSLRDTMPRRKNQKKEGSCAGQAGSIEKEWEEEINHKKFIPLSARFLYDLAKKESGHKEGTTLKAIASTLQKYGICEEELCPYEAGDIVDISKLAYRNALNYKTESYARVKNLHELKQTIFQKYPIGGPTLIGVLVFRGMLEEESRITGVVPDPNCLGRRNPLGGHAISACGWEDDSPYFKDDGHIECQGSWGSFGHDGFHYLSYDYIGRHMLDAIKLIDEKTEITDIRRVAAMTPLERQTSWV